MMKTGVECVAVARDKVPLIWQLMHQLKANILDLFSMDMINQWRILIL